MSNGQEFSEYATTYSPIARSDRKNLSASLKSTLDLIVDELSDNPNKYPARLTKIADNIFIYKHPSPKIEVTYKLNFETKRIEIIHIAALMLEVRKLLFISYSHLDKEWLDELKTCLKPLEDRDLIQLWDDQEIKAGEEWREEIKKALSTAKAALLLVSQNFFDSDFITNNELLPLLEKAKEEGLDILWIAIKPSSVDLSPLEKFQAVHKEPPLNKLKAKMREKKFEQIRNKIKRAVER